MFRLGPGSPARSSIYRGGRRYLTIGKLGSPIVGGVVLGGFLVVRGFVVAGFVVEGFVVGGFVVEGTMVGALRRQGPGGRSSTPEANWQPDDFSGSFSEILGFLRISRIF